VDASLAYASHAYEHVLLPSKPVQLALELKARGRPVRQSPKFQTTPALC
jgi:hypothetical protein